MERHVVVIFPHPDDEAFGAAGTIAEFRKQGVPVTYLCGTLGEMGRNMGNPVFATRESLPEIRKRELLKACASLDIDLEMLGYRDKTLEFENKETIAQQLLTYLNKLQPSLVITHYPGFAVHPDHDAFGAAAIEAVSQMDKSVRPRVWALAITKNKEEKLGHPDVNKDVVNFFDDKLAAIKAHKSQAAGILNGLNEESNDLAQIVKEKLISEQFYLRKFSD